MRPVRASLTIDTKTGAQTVSAWLVGPLAVHRSWRVQGWSITHVATGKAVHSRIATKGAALAATQQLLHFPDCDWAREAEPVVPGARGAALALLRALPIYTKTRAPPRAPPAHGDPEPGTCDTTHP